MCNFPSGKGYIRPTVSPQAAAGKSQVLQLEWAMGPSAAARTGMGGAATRTGMGGAATRTEFGSWRSGKCKFGKLPSGQKPLDRMLLLGKMPFGKNLTYRLK